MNKGLIHTVLLTALLAPAIAFASFGDKNKKITDDKKRKKDDTTQVVSTSAITYDSADSLLMFPSHDLYGSWDTAACHPDLFFQQFNFRFFSKFKSAKYIRNFDENSINFFCLMKEITCSS